MVKLSENDMVYWLILIGSLAVGIPLCRLKYGRAVYCSAMGLVLFLVSALRASVGYDYNLYGGWYMDAQTSSMEDIMLAKQEKGFFVPMKLISDVNPDYQVMFVVIAFIITAAVMLYIYVYSEKPYLSVFFFLTFGLFFNSMNFMRQMIAAAVLLYAMQYIRKNQFIRFLALVLFASVFHVSALIMLPFYFILRIKMDWLTLGTYTAVTVIFMLFSWDILDFITDYVYKGYDPSRSAEVINGTNPIYAVFFSVFFLLAFLLRKELVKEDSFNNVLLNCMFFTAFFEIIGVRHAILSRFAVLFFIPAVVVLIPRAFLVLLKKCEKLLKGEDKRENALKAVAAVLVFGVCTFMYGYMIENNYNGVSPYRTILSVEAARDE